MKELSIIIPAYNEADTLSQCTTRLREVLEGRDFEIIIVEDGCRDETTEVAEKLEEKFAEVRHIHTDKRLGKGKALNKGFNASKGENLGFIDADLSIDPEELERLYRRLEGSGKDIIISSRYTEDVRTDRKRSRLFSSLIYNFFTDKILGTGVKDHQCGLKLFRREVWNSIKDDVSGDRWFWDTSVIYHAKKAGFSIQEIGVEWEKNGESGLNVLRDGPKMAENVIQLKLQEKNIPIDVRYGRFAFIGGLGAALNTAILYLLTEYLNIYYLTSSAVAIETSIIVMFFLNNSFTFRKSKEGLAILTGIIRSNLVRSIGIAANIGFLYFFTEFLNIYFLLSNIMAIFLASVVNFIGEKKFNWKE